MLAKVHAAAPAYDSRAMFVIVGDNRKIFCLTRGDCRRSLRAQTWAVLRVSIRERSVLDRCCRLGNLFRRTGWA